MNLLEPFKYDFMVQAMLISVVVGLICAILSCYVTLKGWSLMGDAVSHAVLPGVAISYLLRIPFAIGAFFAGLSSVIAIGFIKSKTRIKEDTVIGVIFTGFFAFGLIMISKIESDVHLTHILFGDILGITSQDVIQTLVVSAITLITVMIFRKDLMLFCFDPIHARTIGINTTFLYYLLLSLLALTIVAALQTAGIILVVSMLITPGAIAYLLTDRFDKMMIIASLVSVFSSFFGTYISYFPSLPSGPCIVVVQTLIFAIVLIFAPKRGLLASWMAKRINNSR